jgi:hypothetical protein
MRKPPERQQNPTSVDPDDLDIREIGALAEGEPKLRQGHNHLLFGKLQLQTLDLQELLEAVLAQLAADS